MKKQTVPAVPGAPRQVSIEAMPADIAANIRVVDAETGEPIARVIAADTDAGTVSRMAVEDGNLIREGDRFKVIEEERAIRIERIDPQADVSASNGAGEGEAA